MSVQNLAIVFGPTLFMQAQPGPNGQINGMADAGLQNKVRLPPRRSTARMTLTDARSQRPWRRS